MRLERRSFPQQWTAAAPLRAKTRTRSTIADITARVPIPGRCRSLWWSKDKKNWTEKLRRRQSEGRPPDPGKEKADDEDYRGCSIPSSTMATGPRSGDRRLAEEFRGDWCQENTKDNIFKPGGCKLKAGSLSIDRMTLDTGRLSCGFDSGAASDGTLQMRMLCADPEDKESLMYGAQLKLLPGKKIELILEPADQK